jgi:hypothetical protein
MHLAVDKIIVLEDDVYRIVRNDDVSGFQLRNLETGETSSIPLDVAEVYAEPLPEYFVDSVNGEVWKLDGDVVGTYNCITTRNSEFKAITDLWNDYRCRPFSRPEEALSFVIHEMRGEGEIKDPVQDNVEKAAVGTRIRYRSDQEFRVEQSFDGEHIHIVNVHDSDDRRSVFPDELEVVEDF